MCTGAARGPHCCRLCRPRERLSVPPGQSSAFTLEWTLAVSFSVHVALGAGLYPPQAAEMWHLSVLPPPRAFSPLLGRSSVYCCTHTKYHLLSVAPRLLLSFVWKHPERTLLIRRSKDKAGRWPLCLLLCRVLVTQLWPVITPTTDCPVSYGSVIHGCKPHWLSELQDSGTPPSNGGYKRWGARCVCSFFPGMCWQLGFIAGTSQRGMTGMCPRLLASPEQGGSLDTCGR